MARAIAFSGAVDAYGSRLHRPASVLFLLAMLMRAASTLMRVARLWHVWPAFGSPPPVTPAVRLLGSALLALLLSAACMVNAAAVHVRGVSTGCVLRLWGLWPLVQLAHSVQLGFRMAPLDLR